MPEQSSSSLGAADNIGPLAIGSERTVQVVGQLIDRLGQLLNQSANAPELVREEILSALQSAERDLTPKVDDLLLYSSLLSVQNVMDLADGVIRADGGRSSVKRALREGGLTAGAEELVRHIRTEEQRSALVETVFAGRAALRTGVVTLAHTGAFQLGQHASSNIAAGVEVQDVIQAACISAGAEAALKDRGPAGVDVVGLRPTPFRVEALPDGRKALIYVCQEKNMVVVDASRRRRTVEDIAPVAVILGHHGDYEVIGGASLVDDVEDQFRADVNRDGRFHCSALKVSMAAVKSLMKTFDGDIVKLGRTSADGEQTGRGVETLAKCSTFKGKFCDTVAASDFQIGDPAKPGIVNLTRQKVQIVVANVEVMLDYNTQTKTLRFTRNSTSRAILDAVMGHLRGFAATVEGSAI